MKVRFIINIFSSFLCHCIRFITFINDNAGERMTFLHWWSRPKHPKHISAEICDDRQEEVITRGTFKCSEPITSLPHTFTK